MGVELAESGNVFIPEVPPSVKANNPELYEFLQSFKRAVETIPDAMLSNTLILATAMNLGVSGTFTISSGGTIIVTSGIVTTVTS